MDLDDLASQWLGYLGVKSGVQWVVVFGCPWMDHLGREQYPLQPESQQVHWCHSPNHHMACWEFNTYWSIHHCSLIRSYSCVSFLVAHYSHCLYANSWIIMVYICVYYTNLYNTCDHMDLAAGDPGQPTVLADHRGGRCSWSWSRLLEHHFVTQCGIWRYLKYRKHLNTIWTHLKTIVGATCCKPLLSTLVTILTILICFQDVPIDFPSSHSLSMPNSAQSAGNPLPCRCPCRPKQTKNGTHQSSGSKMSWI